MEKEVRLHVVDERDIDLDHDGLLGNPFCSKRVIIDCCNETIRIPLYNFETSFYRRTIVPAHSRKILTLKVCQESPKIGLVNLSNLPHGLQALEGIVEKSSEQEIFLPMTDQTGWAIDAHPLQVSLVPVKKLLLIRVIQNITNDRKSLLKTALRLEHLPNCEREDLKLLWEYNDLVFLPGDSLERSVVKAEFKINTSPTTPAHARLYRFPNIHKTEVECQIQEYLHQGIVRPSSSPWNAPVWVVPKKWDADGVQKWCVVVDYRRLNEQVIPDEYPLPNIRDIFDFLGKARIFMTLDLASGFHQVPVAESDIEKTAFSIPSGHFEFVRMPYGLSNAPRAFQRIINNALTGLLGTECLVYMDDIVIHADSWQTHQRRLRHVLNC